MRSSRNRSTKWVQISEVACGFRSRLNFSTYVPPCLPDAYRKCPFFREPLSSSCCNRSTFATSLLHPRRRCRRTFVTPETGICRAYYLTQRSNALRVQPPTELIDQAGQHGRRGEDRRADLDRGRTCHEDLERVAQRRDAAKADDRDPHRLRRLVDHS